MNLADEEIKRQGVVTGEDGVIKKNGKNDGCIVQKNGEEDFETIRDQLNDAVCSIVTELTEGNAAVTEEDGKDSPCKFCGMRPVCRKELKITWEEDEEDG